jgi:hypothetical protein
MEAAAVADAVAKQELRGDLSRFGLIARLNNFYFRAEMVGMGRMDRMENAPIAHPSRAMFAMTCKLLAGGMAVMAAQEAMAVWGVALLSTTLTLLRYAKSLWMLAGDNLDGADGVDAGEKPAAVRIKVGKYKFARVVPVGMSATSVGTGQQAVQETPGAMGNRGHWGRFGW